MRSKGLTSLRSQGLTLFPSPAVEYLKVLCHYLLVKMILLSLLRVEPSPCVIFLHKTMTKESRKTELDKSV